MSTTTKILVLSAASVLAVACSSPTSPTDEEPVRVTLAVLVVGNVSHEPVRGLELRLSTPDLPGVPERVQRTDARGRSAWQVRTGYRYLVWVRGVAHFGEVVVNDSQWLLGIPEEAR